MTIERIQRDPFRKRRFQRYVHPHTHTHTPQTRRSFVSRFPLTGYLSPSLLSPSLRVSVSRVLFLCSYLRRLLVWTGGFQSGEAISCFVSRGRMKRAILSRGYFCHRREREREREGTRRITVLFSRQSEKPPVNFGGSVENAEWMENNWQ